MRKRPNLLVCYLRIFLIAHSTLIFLLQYLKIASLKDINEQCSVNIPASLQLMIVVGPGRFQVEKAQSNHCLDTDIDFKVGRERPLISVS